MFNYFVTNRVRKSLLAGSALLILAACNNDEEDAKTVLSEALQSYATVTDEALSSSDRIAALDNVEAAFRQISEEYPTTDVGLKLAGRETFGVLDPSALTDVRSKLVELASVEMCAELPTIGCISALIASQDMQSPSPSGNPSEIISGVVLSSQFDAQDYANVREAEVAAPYVALMGLLGGKEDRVQDFIEEAYPTVRPEVGAVTAMMSRLDRLIPSRDAENTIAAVTHYVGNLENQSDPAIRFLSGLLNGTASNEELEAIWQEMSETGFRPELPSWLYEKEVFENLDDPQYREQAADGLGNFRDSDLTPDQAAQIGLIALEEGRDLVKGEQLWFAAQYGVADRLIDTAESLDGPLNFRGYYSVAYGAMQLGYDNDRELFERIKTLMDNPPTLPPSYLETTYAFGRALAGDQSLLADIAVGEGVEELAGALQGVDVADIRSLFDVTLDPRIPFVSEENIDLAKLFNWDFANGMPSEQEIDANALAFKAAIDRAIGTGSLDQRAVADLLRQIRNDDLREFLMANLEDPTMSMSIASQFDISFNFYQYLIFNPVVQENSAESYLSRVKDE